MSDFMSIISQCCETLHCSRTQKNVDCSPMFNKSRLFWNSIPGHKRRAQLCKRNKRKVRVWFGQHRHSALRRCQLRYDRCYPAWCPVLCVISWAHMIRLLLFDACMAQVERWQPSRRVASSAVWVAALRLQPQVPLLRLAGAHFSMLPEKTVFSRALGSRV